MILKIFCVLLLVIVIAAIVTFIISFKSRKISFKEAMDLTDIPVITFYNKGKKINLLLDTGANYSVIDASILKDYDHVMTNKVLSSTVGMGGNIENSSVCEMVFHYNKYRFENEFTIIDMKEAFSQIKKESGVTIHGILGTKFFTKYGYMLDFANLTVYI